VHAAATPPVVRTARHAASVPSAATAAHAARSAASEFAPVAVSAQPLLRKALPSHVTWGSAPLSRQKRRHRDSSGLWYEVDSSIQQLHN
jgi:hypothetical protein